MEDNGALMGQEAEMGDQQEFMESLLQESLSLEFPTQGEIRRGFVATIRDNEILVSIGTKSEGVISGRELEQIPADERASFVVGQEIPVFVISPEDQNGNVVLSYVRAREEKDWDDVEALRTRARLLASIRAG
jgi:small subunit ribosomal protein S1